MGVLDKFTSFLYKSDDNYVDEYEDDNDEFDFEPQQEVQVQGNKTNFLHKRQEKSASNVVNMNEGKTMNTGKTNVILQKVTKLEDVYKVADHLKENRIITLNLENCPDDVIQRVIDILYGVSYAIDGSFEKSADRAYIIAPRNVTVSGDIDSIESELD